MSLVLIVMVKVFGIAVPVIHCLPLVENYVRLLTYKQLRIMKYELNEQQRTQIYAVLWHWRHVQFPNEYMPLTDELLQLFDKPLYKPTQRHGH